MHNYEKAKFWKDKYQSYSKKMTIIVFGATFIGCAIAQYERKSALLEGKLEILQRAKPITNQKVTLFIEGQDSLYKEVTDTIAYSVQFLLLNSSNYLILVNALGSFYRAKRVTGPSVILTATNKRYKNMSILLRNCIIKTHNLKAAGSNPAPATNIFNALIDF